MHWIAMARGSWRLFRPIRSPLVANGSSELSTSPTILSKGTRPLRMLQSVTELRMLSAAGYMPDLVACDECAAYESEVMYFLPQSGVLRCKDCFEGANEPYIALPPGVLTAMRHIVFSDFNKLYSFSLPEDALKILNAATESYVVHTLHTVPKTLEFYKTFLD